MGLDESFLRFYYDCGDDAARRTLTGTTLVAIGLASGVVLAVLLAGAPTFSRLLLGSAEHAWTLRLLALNGFLQAFLCVPHSLLRIRNQPARFARWTVGGGLGAAAGRLLLVVGFRMGVFGIMLADLLASVVLVAGLSRVVERPIGRASWQRAREMLRFSLPLVPTALLQQVTMMSDRFFLRLSRPLSDVGIYQLGGTIANVLRIYPEAFRRAWMPFAFETMDQPDAPRQFARLATVGFAVLVFGTLAIAILAGPVVQIMTPPTFHGAAAVVPFLVLSVALHGAAVFLTTSLNVVKRTRALPVAAAAAAAVTVAGHVTLIPRFGLLGAAGATAAGQAARVIVMAIVAQRLYHIPYETGRLLRTALAGLVVYAAAGFAPADVSAEALIVRGGPGGHVSAGADRPPAWSTGTHCGGCGPGPPRAALRTGADSATCRCGGGAQSSSCARTAVGPAVQRVAADETRHAGRSASRRRSRRHPSSGARRSSRWATPHTSSRPGSGAGASGATQ